MREKPRILKTRLLVETRLFRLERVELRFSNGVEQNYERILPAYPHAVLVVPMYDKETVLLVREYAVGTDRYELALPKGRLQPGEDPLDAANREMKEEIGYGSRDLSRLATFTVAPGFLGHATYIVLAQSLYQERLSGDEPEALDVVPWQLNQLERLFEREDVTEARSIAALYRAKAYLDAAALQE